MMGPMEEQSHFASTSLAADRSVVGGSAVSLGLWILSIGPVFILILLAAVISLFTPNFLKPGNLSNILAQTAVIAIVAIGQQLVILTEELTCRSAPTWRFQPLSAAWFSGPLIPHRLSCWRCS